MGTEQLDTGRHGALPADHFKRLELLSMSRSRLLADLENSGLSPQIYDALVAVVKHSGIGAKEGYDYYILTDDRDHGDARLLQVEKALAELQVEKKICQNEWRQLWRQLTSPPGHSNLVAKAAEEAVEKVKTDYFRANAIRVKEIAIDYAVSENSSHWPVYKGLHALG